MTTLKGREIAIVGGGIVGLSSARALAERGARVQVFERGNFGREASWAAGGMLAPTAEVDFEETELLRLGRESLELYPAFVSEVENEAESRVGYRTDGTLVVGLDRDDRERLDRLDEYRETLGLSVGRLSGDEAREREPALSPNVHSATACPEDHQVNPRALVDALVESLERRGVILRAKTEIDEIVCEEGAVVAIESVDGRSFGIDDVVVATGAWTSQLDGVPADDMPHIRPVRGEMIAVELGEPPLLSHVIRAPGAYLVPRAGGPLVIGATSEERGFDERLTAGGVLELLHGAWQVAPAIDDQAIVDMWTGFRPVSLDGRPVIGPTTTEGLWMATGHGRNGILLAPVTARLLADSIEKGGVVDGYQEFAPNRFAR